MLLAVGIAGEESRGDKQAERQKLEQALALFSPNSKCHLTVGNIPKHISPEDMKTLKDYLSKAELRLTAGIELQISADQYSRSSLFVDGFYTLFHDSHWPMKDAGVAEVMTLAGPTVKKFQGAVVAIKGEPFQQGGEDTVVREPDPLYYIGNVFLVLSRAPI
jgi:hypothetical protein